MAWGHARARGAALRRIAAFAWMVALLSAAGAGSASAAGITNSGDDLRDGWYPNQPKLAPDVVGGGTFGGLWSADVDGQVYAQPLVSDGHVVVATERNQVVSFDSESGAKAWSRTLPHGTPWKPSDIGCSDLLPDIGVTGTPVIDPATKTIYLTHKTYVSGTSGPAQWWMDALDADTGEERANFPVLIQGKAQNNGVTFNATEHMQRPGLLLMDGVVYVGFGSHCDHGTWQGWVFGVNATSAAITARWASAFWGAGIWQSGSGLMSDGPGRIYLSTGNGASPPVGTSAPGTTFGESVVRLAVQPSGALKAMDFFAPYDAARLDDYDADFASGGVTALRDDVFGTPQFPHVAVAVGKAGYVYLLNRDDLGGIGTGTGGGDRVLDRVGPHGGVWSRPGIWPGDGGWIAIPTASPSGGDTPASGGSSGFLKLYRYRKTAGGAPSLDSPVSSDDAFGFSSSAPVITSDGMTSGTAVLWIIWAPAGSGVGAQLRAYDAVPVNGHLRLRNSWPIGTSAKFTMPGVGDGRMYVGTRDGKVMGFGAPVQARVQAPSTTFGVTTVGQTTHADVTLTVAAGVKITSVGASPSAFAAQSGGLALPKTFPAGGTLTVPVDFTPATPGTAGGTLTVTTTEGPFTFGLSGTGQAVAPLLTASPPTLSFGGAVVGEHRADTITFGNGGGQPLTIESLALPGAPFTLQNAPAVGDTIAPGDAINITVHYDPTAPGQSNDDLTLQTTGGDAKVGLSGTAGIGPHLVVAPGSGWEFGEVPVGETKTVPVTFSNTGDSPLNFTRSKFPTDPAITVLDALAEGTTIGAGQSVTLRLRFAPTTAGTVSDLWSVNAGDGTGVHDVPVTATGTGSPGDPGTPADPGSPGDPGGAGPPGDPGVPADTGGTGNAGPGAPDAGAPPPVPGLTPVPIGPGLTGQDVQATAPKLGPGLKLASVRLARDKRRLTVVGLSSPLAIGSLSITVSAQITTTKTVTIVTGRRLRGGRFVVHVNLPSTARSWRALKVSARFGGNARVAAGSSTRTLTRAR
jgi:iron transport multicopper oxidase